MHVRHADIGVPVIAAHVQTLAASAWFAVKSDFNEGRENNEAREVS